MRKLSLLTLALLFPLLGVAAEPTDASLKALLEASGLPAAIGTLSTSSSQYAHQVIDQAIKGRDLTEQQKKNLDGLGDKFSAAVQQDMSYDKMSPLYMKIYRENFTQEEVDGLVAFFKTPAGVAYLKKMPQVMQKTSEASRNVMVPLMQKLQADISGVLEPKK